MRKFSPLYLEARRCADQASRGVSPRMFRGLETFYKTLAATEPDRDGHDEVRGEDKTSDKDSAVTTPRG